MYRLTRPFHLKIFIITVLLLFAGLLSAEEKEGNKNIRNITPYVGVLRCDYEGGDIEKDDNSVMSGLYLQWINPDLFQINSFIYGSGDMFNETFIGFHIMGDWYIKHPENGKWALGAGFEYLKPDVDISTEEAGTVTRVDIKNNIYIPFVRGGRYFNFDIGETSSFMIFHWAGYQMAISRGDGDVTITHTIPPPPPTTADAGYEDETSYAITGLKLGLNLMRIIDLSIKYKAAMNSEDFFNTVDTMANFYFTRNLGVSFRHKFSENNFCKIDYSIFGINYSF